jgi:hypothetical protein
MRFVTVPQVLRTISHCHPDRRPAACAGRSGGIAAPSQRFGSIFVFLEFRPAPRSWVALTGR